MALHQPPAVGSSGETLGAQLKNVTTSKLAICMYSGTMLEMRFDDAFTVFAKAYVNPA